MVEDTAALVERLKNIESLLQDIYSGLADLTGAVNRLANQQDATPPRE